MMNAITTIEQDEPVALSFADDLSFDEWVKIGGRLLSEKRKVNWAIADWARVGFERFGEQLSLAFDDMGIDSKRAMRAAKVSATIAPAWRPKEIDFEVCEEIAKIDDQEKLRATLQQAERERWNTRAAHHAVVEYRYETGDLFDDEDKDTRQAVELIRAWNRVSPEAREYFFALAELAAANSFTAIDEDRAI